MTVPLLPSLLPRDTFGRDAYGGSRCLGPITEEWRYGSVYNISIMRILRDNRNDAKILMVAIYQELHFFSFTVVTPDDSNRSLEGEGRSLWDLIIEEKN